MEIEGMILLSCIWNGVQVVMLIFICNWIKDIKISMIMKKVEGRE